MRAPRPLLAFILVASTALVLTGCGSDANGEPAAKPAATDNGNGNGSDGNGGGDNGNAEDAALITVRGTGRIEAEPDLMTISLGVQTHAPTANEALDEANGSAATVIMVLEEKGVEKRDIQTNALSLWPTFDDKGKITGYAVTNSLTAKLRDLENAGAIIDAAVGMVGDAVRLDSVSFSIDDTDELALAARRDAVERAAEQAEALADGAGVELGPVRSIDEITTVPPTPVGYDGEAAGLRAADSVPIEAGSQELSLEVEVVYEIAG